MARRRLSPAEREVVARLVSDARLEVLPLRGLDEQLAVLRAGARLTVTASPAKGLEAGVAAGERLRAAGFEVTVHLAAKMVRDAAHLRALLDRMEAAGLDRAFVVGGDAARAGEYPDALALLGALESGGHHLTEIGIAGYPQGHPEIPDDALRSALAAKAAHAHYVTTQLCFDTDALAGWVAAVRRDGLSLPIEIGMPGAVDVARLVRVSARIGVTDAARFAGRQLGLVGRLLRPGGYRPDRLLEGLAPLLADPAAAIRGLHVYTFNQLDRTETWRRTYGTGS